MSTFAERVHGLTRRQRIMASTVIAGIAVFLAVALWPITVDDSYSETHTDFSGPYPYEETVVQKRVITSCGPPLFAMDKDGLGEWAWDSSSEQPSHCADQAKGRVIAGGILGGLLLAAGIFFVPLLAHDERRAPWSVRRREERPIAGGESGRATTATLTVARRTEPTESSWHPLSVAAVVASGAGVVIMDVALVGLILGIVALVQLGTLQPEPRGRGLAWTAVVLGGFMFVGPVVSAAGS